MYIMVYYAKYTSEGSGIGTGRTREVVKSTEIRENVCKIPHVDYRKLRKIQLESTVDGRKRSLKALREILTKALTTILNNEGATNKQRTTDKTLKDVHKFFAWQRNSFMDSFGGLKRGCTDLSYRELHLQYSVAHNFADPHWSHQYQII